MAKAISLNKAGKVRGQTPKVEKSEKEKALTGRAAWRAKFKRRQELFTGVGKFKFNKQGDF
uniref:eS30 SEE n=1 Tax=Spraguea lophii (strain 42_110) TaxID=1358809 RepID=UPI0022656FAD|nr:Chain SEE, eS30 SEE [Spraguea lophii 42_110]7QJH_REE Chain REE, eS30 [Spraguea lophii 42_110]7QJH_SEE Chain SEE, eS30 [Spraguea lophii 42_110]8BR3_SEE Chain SEE, eS30 [Spraguea lophii 42_110]8P5D_SEE Chain SEE, eS30 [Spraguea lophii 42_110]8P60_REE Chain REE, 40S ribosomal protein S30 [Spraguea lophii 42_110]8P60_SEE Chain SEE, 40S ribosomal protein S30 [Spraguea lophii 42_110]